MRVADIAELCNELDRAYCLSIDEPEACYPSWHEANAVQKYSALRRIEFLLENPNYKPESTRQLLCKTVVDSLKKFLPKGEAPEQQCWPG